MSTSAGTVLIAIDPPLLATALASILRALPIAVDVFGAPADHEGDYSLAIVTGHLPANVTAQTVLSLPDVESKSVIALLRRDSVSQPVRVSNLEDVMGVIRSAVPT